MIYDLGQEIDAEKAKTRLLFLINKKAIVELTEHKPTRSIRQNSYLHLLLGYFASQTGNTLEWVKQQYYKKTCNPDLYVRERSDNIIGKTYYLRSSRELKTDEMTLSIERFRNWAAAEAGIYLPEAINDAELAAMMIEVEKYKVYL